MNHRQGDSPSRAQGLKVWEAGHFAESGFPEKRQLPSLVSHPRGGDPGAGYLCVDDGDAE